MTTQSQATLTLGQLQRDASSYVDPHGFVFHHEGEIYRYIRPDAAPQFQRLLGEGILAELEQECGLVSSEPAGLCIDGQPDAMVLKHRRIQPLSYCVEWCPSMLRDAGIATLELALAGLPHGLMLQDAYPWNVVFEGPRPVFVDVTSLSQLDKDVIWPAHEQFEAFFYRPLLLAQMGHGNVARSMLYDNLQGISLDAVYRMMSTSQRAMRPGLTLTRWVDGWMQRSATLKEKIRGFAENACKDITPELRHRFLSGLLKKLKAFRFRAAGDPWHNYYAEIDDAVDKQAKIKAIRQLLSATQPQSVLDLGCNTGVFSIEAAQLGARVTSVDSSEPCIELLYSTARNKDLAITPLISDVLCPTPAYGFMGRQYPSLWERTKSDVVLCLGLMHHLHLSGRQSWDRIVELMDTVTKRHLIFEFVAIDDDNNAHLPQRREINYDLESVKQALSQCFAKIEVHDSDRSTRRLLLCSK